MNSEQEPDMQFGIWLAGVTVLGVAITLVIGMRARGETGGAAFRTVSLLIPVFATYLSVGAVFLAIAWWASSFDVPESTLRSLWDLERRLSAFSSAAHKFEIPSAAAAILLFALAWLSRRRELSFSARFLAVLRLYRKHLARILLAATALASFSIFDGAVAGAHASIRARIKRVEQEYGIYRAEARAAMTQATSAAILSRMAEEPPASVRAVLNLKTKVANRSAQWDEAKQNLNEDFGIDPPVAPNPVPPRAVWPRPSPSQHSAAPETYPREEAAAASAATLANLRSRLRDFTAKAHREAAQALGTLAGEDVPAEAIEALLAHDNFSVFRELSDSNPLLGAIFKVFEKVAAEKLGDKLKDYLNPEEIYAAAKQTAASAIPDWRPAEASLAHAKREEEDRLADANHAIDSCRQAYLRESRRLLALDVDLYSKTRARAIERATGVAREQTIFLFDPKPGDDREALFAARAELAVSAREDKELDDIFRTVPPRKRHRRMTAFAVAVAAGGKTEDAYWQAVQARTADAFRASAYEEAREQERDLRLPRGMLSQAYESKEQRAQRLDEESRQRIKSEDEARAYEERLNRAFAERTGRDWDPVKGFIPRNVTFLGMEVPEAVAIALEAAEAARVP